MEREYQINDRVTVNGIVAVIVRFDIKDGKATDIILRPYFAAESIGGLPGADRQIKDLDELKRISKFAQRPMKREATISFHVNHILK